MQRLLLTLCVCLPAFANAAESDIKPLLVKYCYGCHGDGNERGDVMLDKGKEMDAKLWQRVYDALDNDIMPPAKKPQPSVTERARIASWIERDVFRVDCKAPDPGRVTTRRLNRQEYRNTVRDLLGVDFDTAEEFPPDDTGYGFDNIGDVLNLSPVLMEKYFNAAAQVVKKAVVFGKPTVPRVAIGRGGLKTVDEATGKVTLEARFKLAVAGKYQVQLAMSVSSFDPWTGKASFTADLDGERLTAKTYSYDGIKVYRYDFPRALAAGSHTVRLVLDTTAAKGVAFNVDEVAAKGPLGLPPEYPESHKRVFFKGAAPVAEADQRDYAAEILDRIATRAFRRPVDAATRERLLALTRTGASFEEGIAQALQAVLVSPRFLFRTETQPRPNDPNAVHPVDEFSLASRLSYWLWTSLPDQQLLDVAAAGKLRANLRAEVKRMMADPKADRFVADFVGQWLQTRDVEGIFINNRRYPELTATMRKLLRTETEMSFAHIMREDRDVMELLTADYTFLNAQLARFYRLPAVEGLEMRKVQVPAGSHRGGILSQGSFLVVTSNPTRTSPVKRGLFVLDNILGTPPPPPPPDIPNLEDAKNKDGQEPATLREQLELHRANPACANCHARMDPIGLALENFSLIGQWRETEGDDIPIDPRGELVTGETISGVDDLRRILGSRKAPFYRASTRKLMTYALGRGLETYDKCAVEAIVQKMVTTGGRFSTMLEGVIDSVPFQMRRGDGKR